MISPIYHRYRALIIGKEVIKPVMLLPVKLDYREEHALEIIYKNPQELDDYSNNPRNNFAAIEPVMDSIRQFGFLVPILIDKNNEIIAGHTRKAAAIKLGLDLVPCICAVDLTEEQVQAYRLVDNKTAEFATWDFDKLRLELDQIIDVDLAAFQFPDFGDDLTVTDDDFIQGNEIVKEKKTKTIICPKCGAEIEL